MIFSGGLPQDITGAQPSITVLQGKHTTVLEMEFCVIDFVLVTDTPYKGDYNDPESILVLLTNDLVAIDCKSAGLPGGDHHGALLGGEQRKEEQWLVWQRVACVR